MGASWARHGYEGHTSHMLGVLPSMATELLRQFGLPYLGPRSASADGCARTGQVQGGTPIPGEQQADGPGGGSESSISGTTVRIAPETGCLVPLRGTIKPNTECASNSPLAPASVYSTAQNDPSCSGGQKWAKTGHKWPEVA